MLMIIVDDSNETAGCTCTGSKKKKKCVQQNGKQAMANRQKIACRVARCHAAAGRL